MLVPRSFREDRDVKRSTQRGPLIAAVAFALVVATVLFAIVGAPRVRSSFTGPYGWGSMAILVAFMAMLGYGVYRTRVRPRMNAGAISASGAGLRHASTDRFGLHDLPFDMLARLAPPWRIGNVLWGRWEGLDVTVFDVWSAGRHIAPSEDGSSADPGQGHAYRCVVTSFPAAWPSLVVEPERLTTQLSDAVSLGDIELESDAFNRRFDVRCDDRRFATAFLDARMMGWLLSLQDESGFEIGSGLVLVYGELHDMQESTTSLATVRGFLEHVPEVVYSLYPPGDRPVVVPPPVR
jgi:hypothetical protein